MSETLRLLEQADDSTSFGRLLAVVVKEVDAPKPSDYSEGALMNERSLVESDDPAAPYYPALFVGLENGNGGEDIIFMDENGVLNAGKRIAHANVVGKETENGTTFSQNILTSGGFVIEESYLRSSADTFASTRLLDDEQIDRLVTQIAAE